MKAQDDKFILTLQGVAKTGRHWDVTIPAAQFTDASFDGLLEKDAVLHDFLWKGSLVPTGDEFVLTGQWQMQAPRQCGRCNAKFSLAMQQHVQLAFVLGNPLDEQSKASADVEMLAAPGEMNVLDVLREQFWLAWQPMAVCSEDCKGLCQQCGMNLNSGKCDCHAKREDHPFAALQGLKFDA